MGLTLPAHPASVSPTGAALNLLTLEGISKQYSERLLLDAVDLRINRGDRIGLIGINGSGKSTLLRIAAGLEAPDAGRVTVWGGVRLRYLPQAPVLDAERSVLDQVLDGEAPALRLLADYRAVLAMLEARPGDAAAQARLAELGASMDRAGAWAAEAEAKAMLDRLGLGAYFESPAGQLSGGMQKRVALARALLDPGDLLILDEPTNHVDAEALAWLEEVLLRLPALLLVTHDRYFLDRVVNRIVELDRRSLVSYPGGYARYLELRGARHERLAQAEADRRRLLARELDWLRRSPKARGTKQKARAERAAELERLAYDSGEEQVVMTLAGRRLGRKVLEARGLAKAYGGAAVFRNLDFRLGPGDRIGIVGPNGAGKSTLLDLLAGRAEADAGTLEWGETVRLAYFDQGSRGLPADQRVIAYLEREAPLVQTAEGERISAARMLEWFLFPRPQQHALIGSLSGGEQRRLYLLATLMHQPNVIFLDEPTNDLDLITLNVLEEFLDHFTGSLVVVSHDRYFLDRTVDQIAVFEQGRLRTGYPAPFETFLRLRAAERAAESSSKAPPPSKTAPRPAGRVAVPAAGLSWKERQELAALEARVEALGRRQAELEAAINAAGGDFLRLESLTAEHSTAAAELELAMARWLALSEKES